ncbi:MAG: hypothetical protein OXL96_11230, partial [Candidatus Poribacteria bacterium]|nr:hypothetical protein [Candidatus Poribacteria bacterium]
MVLIRWVVRIADWHGLGGLTRIVSVGVENPSYKMNLLYEGSITVRSDRPRPKGLTVTHKFFVVSVGGS